MVYIFGHNGFHSRNLCCGLIASSGHLAQASIHNDTRYDDSQHYDTQDNNTEHIAIKM